jgi:predicted DNA-binding transcriptional regulator AlpA
MKTELNNTAARFLTWEQVCASYIKMSRDTRDRWEQEGRFPSRIVIGPRRIVWSEAEIIAWQQRQIEGRNDATAREVIRRARMPRIGSTLTASAQSADHSLQVSEVPTSAPTPAPVRIRRRPIQV